MTVSVPRTMFERTTSSLGAGTQQRLSATSTGQTSQTLPGINPYPLANTSSGGSGQSTGAYAATDPRRLDTQSGRDLAASERKKSSVGKDTQTAAASKQPTVNNDTASNVPMDSPKVAPIKPLNESYPDDLAMSNDRHYFQLLMGPYNDEVAMSANSTVQHNVSIALPLPANLTTATSLDYSNVAMGPLGGEALESVQRLRDVYNKGGDVVQALRGEVSGLAREIFKSGDSDLRQTVVRRAIASAVPTLGSAIDIMTGTTPNPHIAVTFNNVKFRSFSYSWKFSPNSVEDSDKLTRIIAKIHECALPRKGNSRLLLTYPYQCKLRFSPEVLNDLFRFKPCVIDAVNVNYAPNGVPSFFAGTQMPTDIELAITFQEIQIRTSEDYPQPQQGTN